jgi:hypothetical protein
LGGTYKTYESTNGSNLRFMRYCGNYFFLSSGGPPTRCKTMSNNFTYVIAGGHIACNQCQATSKRSRQRCKAPAMKGKTVCLTHGGLSTGPRTEAGRLKARLVNLKHGRETREARTERSLASARLAVLEMAGYALGFMHGGKARGRKPALISKVEQELQQVVLGILLRQTSTK